jgi:hypothetical protein
MGKFTLTHRFKNHKYIYTVTGFTGEHEAANGDYWKLETIPANISPDVGTHHEIYTNGKCFLVYGSCETDTWILINDIEKFDPWGDEAFRAFASGYWQSPTYRDWYLADGTYTVIENAVTFYTNISNDYYTISGAGELYNGNYYFVNDYDPDDYDHSSPYVSEMYDIYTNGEHRLIINKSNNNSMLIVSEYFSPGYGNYDNFDDIKFECTNGIWKEKAESFESGYSTLILEFHKGTNPNGSPSNNTNPDTNPELVTSDYPSYTVTLDNGQSWSLFKVLNSSQLNYPYINTIDKDVYASYGNTYLLAYAESPTYSGWILTTDLNVCPTPSLSDEGLIDYDRSNPTEEIITNCSWGMIDIFYPIYGGSQ